MNPSYPPIMIYSTPSCPYCTMAKQYFTSKNIPYTDYNVAIDQSKAIEMIGKSGQMGVPVIDIGGKIILGFNIVAINQALGL